MKCMIKCITNCLTTFVQFFKVIVRVHVPLRQQRAVNPSIHELKKSMITSKGRIWTTRTWKTYCNRVFRKMLPSEIIAATEQLANEGIVNLIPSGDSSWIIIKKPEDKITEQILAPYDISDNSTMKCMIKCITKCLTTFVQFFKVIVRVHVPLRQQSCLLYTSPSPRD